MRLYLQKEKNQYQLKQFVAEFQMLVVQDEKVAIRSIFVGHTMMGLSS